jgi:hypothetical protein
MAAAMPSSLAYSIKSIPEAWTPGPVNLYFCYPAFTETQLKSCRANVTKALSARSLPFYTENLKKLLEKEYNKLRGAALYWLRKREVSQYDSKNW